MPVGFRSDRFCSLDPVAALTKELKSCPRKPKIPLTTSLESLLESATTLAKAGSAFATSLTEHLNAISRVDHGDGSRGPTPTDHAARAKITATITALGDFRLTVRHSLLLGVHDEAEKTKIIRGDYC
jgi:hypothetical protein